MLQNQANAQKQVVKQTALNHEETQKQLEGVATKTTKKIKSLMVRFVLFCIVFSVVFETVPCNWHACVRTCVLVYLCT